MLKPSILDFLSQLKQNNYREWFHENKTLYNQAKTDFEDFTNILINETKKIDPSLGMITAKDSTFRIFRDVRFSKNKSPYKTNFGAFLVKNGKKSGNAGYYVHIDPDECFWGGGIHMPPNDLLKKVRTEIYNFTDEFLEIINNPTFKKTFGEINGEKLKKVPRDFPSDFEHGDLLKYKSYTVGQMFDKSEIDKPQFLEKTLEIFKAMSPFILFINRAIQEN